VSDRCADVFAGPLNPERVIMRREIQVVAQRGRGIGDNLHKMNQELIATSTSTMRHGDNHESLNDLFADARSVSEIGL
jgi:hypothetical protein